MSENSKYKIVVTGSKGVGKTSLVYRFISGKFKADTIGTVGVDMSTKTMDIDERKINLVIWDFAGEEKFRVLMPKYCAGAQGAILLYDLTREETFAELEDWIPLLNKYTLNSKKILIGSKADLVDQRTVSEEDALDFQSRNNIDFYLESSSKTGQNVDEIFETLIRAIIAPSGTQCPYCNEYNSPEVSYCQYCNRKLK